jgi:lysophospholipase L1-like esterase
MRSALFWLSLPFILPQAIKVRRTALRSNGATGPPQGVVGKGDTKRLLVYGDSIAAGVGATDFRRALVGQAARALSDKTKQQIRWTADGKIGANSERLLRTLDDSFNGELADYIILSIGVNDVTSLATLNTWRSNLDALLTRLKAIHDEPVIAVAGLPPLSGFPLLPEPLRSVVGGRGIAFDRAARDVVAAHAGAVHVPVEFPTTPERFADDGFHPSEAGYAEFGEVMGTALADLAAAHKQ